MAYAIHSSMQKIAFACTYVRHGAYETGPSSIIAVVTLCFTLWQICKMFEAYVKLLR